MRGIVHNLYAFAFRGQALVGLGLVVWFISSVPNALTRDLYVGGPLAIAVIAGVTAIASIWPFLTPHWVGRPRRKSQLVPLLLTHTMLPFLYIFVAMSGVVAADLEEPIAQNLTAGLLLLLLVASVLCWGFGTILCFWSRRSIPPVSIVIDNPPAETVPIAKPAARLDYEEVPASQMKAS